MGYMTIDGRKVEFTDEPNVLSVIRNADIDIPTLCYHSELSVQNRQEMGWSFTRILRVL
jgi:NADH-quinone oxidoreductase subunit G